MNQNLAEETVEMLRDAIDDCILRDDDLFRIGNIILERYEIEEKKKEEGKFYKGV